MAIPASLRQDLGDIPLLEDARSLRMRSRDFFWFSPILKEALEDKRAATATTTCTAPAVTTFSSAGSATIRSTAAPT
jgi:hypothetical protein